MNKNEETTDNIKPEFRELMRLSRLTDPVGFKYRAFLFSGTVKQLKEYLKI